MQRCIVLKRKIRGETADMKYRVVRIDEDIDFGCEERKEGTPVMAVVLLEDEDGNRQRIHQIDQYLYDNDINEEDRVQLTADGELIKVM